MKKTPFRTKPRFPLTRKSPLTPSKGRKGRLRVAGKSDSAELKREIQALLRRGCIARDGGCVLREYPETGACSKVLQAEHLVSRQHTNYFGDLRNIVCLCSRHHIFWKPQNSRLYWEIIEGEIGPSRWDWVKLAEADNKPYKVDLKLVKLALEREVKQLEK